jgi:hypothetical protein
VLTRTVSSPAPIVAVTLPAAGTENSRSSEPVVPVTVASAAVVGVYRIS